MRIAELLDIKGHAVVDVTPETKIVAVVARLVDYNIGAVVVLDESGSIAGIVSERDVIRALERYGPAGLELSVREVMSSVVHTCAPDDTVDSLAAMMTNFRIRHVPVLDGDALVGIVSIGDVVKTRMEELENDRNALADYIGAR
jgi:CBS domain-containing protein